MPRVEKPAYRIGDSLRRRVRRNGRAKLTKEGGGMSSSQSGRPFLGHILTRVSSPSPLQGRLLHSPGRFSRHSESVLRVSLYCSGSRDERSYLSLPCGLPTINTWRECWPRQLAREFSPARGRPANKREWPGRDRPWRNGGKSSGRARTPTIPFLIMSHFDPGRPAQCAPIRSRHRSDGSNCEWRRSALSSPRMSMACLLLFPRSFWNTGVRGGGLARGCVLGKSLIVSRLRLGAYR